MNQPIVVQLEKGTHYICDCGRSLNQPYCDGSHQGSGIQPLVLELESPKNVEIAGPYHECSTKMTSLA